MVPPHPQFLRERWAFDKRLDAFHQFLAKQSVIAPLFAGCCRVLL
jgi:hypothetical protein